MLISRPEACWSGSGREPGAQALSGACVETHLSAFIRCSKGPRAPHGQGSQPAAGFQWFCGVQWFPYGCYFVGGQTLWGHGLLRARGFLSSCPRPAFCEAGGALCPEAEAGLGSLCVREALSLGMHTARSLQSLCGMMGCLGPRGPGPKGTPLCGVSWGGELWRSRKCFVPKS